MSWSLGLAAVVGVGTAQATPVTSVSYCLDGKTVTTTDTELQGYLNESIADEGGALTSAEILPVEETDPDAAGEATESFIDQYYGKDDAVEFYAASQGDIEDDYDADVTNVTAHHVAAGACTSAPSAPPPAREAYCSVAGNTNPFTGAPIPAGTFLNLLAGQPATDKHYTGAVPAWWVQGVGLTCSLTPAQAALAAASTQRVGGAGDPEIPIPGIPDYAIYTFVPAK